MVRAGHQGASECSAPDVGWREAMQIRAGSDDLCGATLKLGHSFAWSSKVLGDVQFPDSYIFEFEYS